jgi:hypothetical protein
VLKHFYLLPPSEFLEPELFLVSPLLLPEFLLSFVEDEPELLVLLELPELLEPVLVVGDGGGGGGATVVVVACGFVVPGLLSVFPLPLPLRIISVSAVLLLVLFLVVL